MADSSATDQSSGFWTLTRPSKLSKRRNSDLHELHHKVFNISVVGLSGVDRDKGPIGIGKSCLCNRFIRSANDDYHTDHISVLSQSDFGGRVVNNDHWLYWGSVIKSCDGYDLAFNVIEQSEFVDDACFQPFKTGKTEPYFKRCANTKLVSAEKLMYICKNQLGIEREYEQRYLPDGKFNVDGFLCLFDVSEVQGRNIDKQIEMTNLIMLNLMKTRKPIVFVTTKHDEASEILVAEAERLINQRDFRGIVPIVETSAQENVNINMAFLVCAQLIDKTRAKLRVPPYFEAYKNHLDVLNAASEAYLGLIRSTVIDYRASWQQVCIKLSHNPEFLHYTYLHGLDKATLVFKNHLKCLREECINQKVQHYLKIFPEIINELAPPRSSLDNNVNNNNNNKSPEATEFPNSSPQSWELTKNQLRSHPLFNKYFLPVPSGISWYDTELLQSSENRIPSDWLDSEEAYQVFQQRNLLLETEQRKRVRRQLFARMLTSTKIPVGKPFIELKHIFSNAIPAGELTRIYAGNSNSEFLSDQEMFEVYVEYQNNLLQQARADFQELLLENAEHLHQLTSSDKVIRQEDIKTINNILQHDERYQALDRFDQDRTLMMIRHLSFLHSQISEQCPSYPKCVEPEVERLLITKAKTLVSRYYENKNDNKSSSSGLHCQKTCDLVIFGPRRPSQQLILALNVLNSRAPKSQQYQITFTVFDNADEVDSQIQRFKQSNTKPKGCFGIFTNRRSLEHVSYTLEKFLLLSSQIQNEKNHFGSPPVVMLYAADITLDERTMLALENEGQQMADRFKCPFMNVTAIDQYRQHQQNNILSNADQDSTNQVMSECASLDYACVDAAFNVLKEAVSRRVCFMELYNNQDLIPRQAFNPDARILMCLLCGEPFSNELFMWKIFLDYEDCYVTSSKSICLKVKFDNGQEKFIEITITSYTHGAFNYREDLLHGFILVCSIQRKASISILNAFSFNIPCTPVLVMAIKSDVRLNHNSNNQLDNEESDTLIKEAQEAAIRLKGHFELLDVRDEDTRNNHVDDTYNINRIRNFLQNVIKRKPTIERAYELGDSDIQLPTASSAYNNDDNYSKKLIAKDSQQQRSRRNQAAAATSAGLSSDDDLVDRNFSDESESAAPPKPLRSTTATTRSDREELQPGLNEVYAKRPLPPIPSALDHNNDLDRDVEFSATSLTGFNNNNNTNTSNKIETINHNHHNAQQASEDTNESSSDDDTEDSTDNKLQDKPKPGKLDLSQFDNITNAIGKLKVQSAIKTPEIMSGANSKLYGSQAMRNENLQDVGFFKNRAKKTKSRTTAKESQLRGDNKEPTSGSKEHLASFGARNRQPAQADVRGIGSNSNQEFKSSDPTEIIRPVGLRSRESVPQRKSSVDDDHLHHNHNQREDDQSLANSKAIRDKSSRSKNEHKSSKPTTSTTNASSSFLSGGQETTDAGSAPQPPPVALSTTTAGSPPTTDLKGEKELPRPAPRSTQNHATKPTFTPPVSSSFARASSGPKRINNPRQNHGRAVAPPQLPGGVTSSANRLDGGDSVTMTSDLPVTTSSHDASSSSSSVPLPGDDCAIDFSQSPIAQRLLKHSKDYKVSELNSPYESDCEPSSQSINQLRGQQQLYRAGQSLGLENNSPSSMFINSSIDSSGLLNSRGAAIRQLNEILANKQPPGRPGGPKPPHSVSRSSSLDQEQQQQQQQPVLQANKAKNDKETKKDKKKLRDDEKLEKRRLKEEERIRRQEKKLAAKKSKSGPTGHDGTVGDDGVPFFIKRCIEFIEYEGLDAEGIYRVPGNRAHVDAFVQKFKENPDMSIVESDIPVNAVATALKDFLSKKWGPIIPLALMNELTELSNILEKEQRVQAVRQLVQKLPSANYKLLKYVFSHFVKVSLNHSLNSMDSKNLAICWWPTLLPLHFNDMVMFEQMRPHLEESIQTMIDQYDFIFDTEEPTSTIN